MGEETLSANPGILGDSVSCTQPDRPARDVKGSASKRRDTNLLRRSPWLDKIMGAAEAKRAGYKYYAKTPTSRPPGEFLEYTCTHTQDCLFLGSCFFCKRLIPWDWCRFQVGPTWPAKLKVRVHRKAPNATQTHLLDHTVGGTHRERLQMQPRRIYWNTQSAEHTSDADCDDGEGQW